MISEIALTALNSKGFWVCKSKQNGLLQTLYLDKEMETRNGEQKKQNFLALIHH